MNKSWRWLTNALAPHRSRLLTWWPFAFVCALAFTHALLVPGALTAGLMVVSVVVGLLGTVSVIAGALVGGSARVPVVGGGHRASPPWPACAFCDRGPATVGTLYQVKEDGACVCFGCAVKAQTKAGNRQRSTGQAA